MGMRYLDSDDDLAIVLFPSLPPPGDVDDEFVHPAPSCTDLLQFFVDLVVLTRTVMMMMMMMSSWLVLVVMLLLKIEMTLVTASCPLLLLFLVLPAWLPLDDLIHFGSLWDSFHVDVVRSESRRRMVVVVLSLLVLVAVLLQPWESDDVIPLRVLHAVLPPAWLGQPVLGRANPHLAKAFFTS